MNLRILIVDDETPIREWIDFCLQKVSLPLEVVGLAANGKEAYELFLEKRPNVVITDISMPVLDGLELIRKIKVISPNTQFVILTCHEDFSYARKAIKLGAVEYLLKTEVTNDKLSEIMTHLSKNAVVTDYDEGRIIERQIYFDGIVNGTFVPEYEKLKNLGIKINTGNYFVVAINVVKQQVVEDLHREFNEYKYGITFFPYGRNIYLLIVATEQVNSKLLQISNVTQFAGLVKSSFNGNIGISRVYSDIIHLKDAVRGAIYQLGVAFYGADSSVNIEIHRPQNNTEINIIEITDAILYKIYSKTRDEIKQDVMHFLQAVEQIKYSDIDQLINCINRIMDRLCEKYPVGKELRPDFSKTLSFRSLWEEVSDYFLSIGSGKTEKVSEYTGKAVHYIEKNYSLECGLNDVAQEVGLNPEYFSRLFKNETGCNFSAYVTKTRMEAAKELLINTDMRVNEIALKVGYQNLAYFSRIFKKYVGITPFDYRK